jgi:hypothetical protein
MTCKQGDIWCTKFGIQKEALKELIKGFEEQKRKEQEAKHKDNKDEESVEEEIIREFETIIDREIEADINRSDNTN